MGATAKPFRAVQAGHTETLAVETVKVGNLSHTNTRQGVPIVPVLLPEVGSGAHIVRFSRPGPGKDAENRHESLEIRVLQLRNAHIPAKNRPFCN